MCQSIFHTFSGCLLSNSFSIFSRHSGPPATPPNPPPPDNKRLFSPPLRRCHRAGICSVRVNLMLRGRGQRLHHKAHTWHTSIQSGEESGRGLCRITSGTRCSDTCLREPTVELKAAAACGARGKAPRTSLSSERRGSGVTGFLSGKLITYYYFYAF